MDAVPFQPPFPPPFQAVAPFEAAPHSARPGAARHELLRLITAMFAAEDEHEVLAAATAALALTGPFTAEAAYTVHDGRSVRRRPREPLDSPAAGLAGGHGAAADGRTGGRADRAAGADAGAYGTTAADPLEGVGALDGRGAGFGDAARDPGGSRLRAVALRHRERCVGYLVVRLLATPTAEEAADADLLAQQAGAALAGLERNEGRPDRPGKEDGPKDVSAHAVGSGAAGSAVAARDAFHDALCRAAASGRGEEGILRTLRDHTGFSALTEDPFGNVRAATDPGVLPAADADGDPAGRRPGPEGRRRDEALHGARRRAGAVRDRDLLVAPVEMAGELLGLVALVDPGLRAAEQDVRALEQAALLLAPQLSHERELAELEPQLRHDLVEKLISGGATEDVFLHAANLGHDLRQPHRVAVLQWQGKAEGAALGAAVARAARRLRLDVLAGTRAATTVALVAGPDPGDDALYRAVSDELGCAAGAVGVGGRCTVWTDLPHSYDEAVRALTVRRRSQDPHGSTSFEELGLYRMMGTGDGEREADRFVREWLGTLLDYDSRHHTGLVGTLAHYLESGGSYDATSEALLIHRSTVRYRLRRIREISGHDLADVETRLNLHVATRIRNVLDVPR